MIRLYFIIIRGASPAGFIVYALTPPLVPSPTFPIRQSAFVTTSTDITYRHLGLRTLL